MLLRERMKRLFKDPVEGNLGLKFLVTLTGVISLFMVAGTIFVARVLMDGQYRELETRGKEVGKRLHQCTRSEGPRGARRTRCRGGAVPGHALRLHGGPGEQGPQQFLRGLQQEPARGEGI